MEREGERERETDCGTFVSAPGACVFWSHPSIFCCWGDRLNWNPNLYPFSRVTQRRTCVMLKEKSNIESRTAQSGLLLYCKICVCILLSLYGQKLGKGNGNLMTIFSRFFSLST